MTSSQSALTVSPCLSMSFGLQVISIPSMGPGFTIDRRFYTVSCEPSPPRCPLSRGGTPGSKLCSQTSKCTQAASFPANTLSSAPPLGSLPDRRLTHPFLTQTPTVLSPKSEQVLAVGVMLRVPPLSQANILSTNTQEAPLWKAPCEAQRNRRGRESGLCPRRVRRVQARAVAAPAS